MEDRFLKQTGNPVLYNLMGEALPQGDLALYDFMLPWEDARIWAGAVGALGGAIKRPQADITHAAVLVRDLEKATQDMQDIVDECEQALEKAVSGTMLHLNQLDEYDEQAWQLYDQAAQIFQSIDQELDILNTLGVSTEELAKTMVSREDAEVSHQKIRMLFRQYQQQRLRAGELLQPRKETRGEAGVGKQQLLQALALHLARGGTASNYKGDKLHIPLPQGVLEIGDQVSLKPKD